MITICRHGTTRDPVIIIGPLAFKWAKNDNGRACNLFERSLYLRSSERRRALLCPALWVSRLGKLLVMRAAMPTVDKMTVEEYLAYGAEWDSVRDEDECPFEPGARNWGWFNGHRVAIDYSATVERSNMPS